MIEYVIEHRKHGCYSVTEVDDEKEAGRYKYLTNFKNKKAAKKFVEEYKKGNVVIDPETRVPTPDFQ
tara:strand:+ start:486 stop:686 length:201 start_codon:yes stop_codon:yes gene_type:complete